MAFFDPNLTLDKIKNKHPKNILTDCIKHNTQQQKRLNQFDPFKKRGHQGSWPITKETLKII